MNRRYVIVVLIISVLYGAAAGNSATYDLHQRPAPKDFSYPEGSQTVQIEVAAGALSGIVADPNGGPLPEVLVERVDSAWTNRFSAMFTDSHGRFRFSRLPNAPYYLKISKPNFSTLKVKVNLRNGAKSRLHLRLPLGI